MTPAPENTMTTTEARANISAATSLSGAQRESFLAQVNAAFGA